MTRVKSHLFTACRNQKFHHCTLFISGNSTQFLYFFRMDFAQKADSQIKGLAIIQLAPLLHVLNHTVHKPLPAADFTQEDNIRINLFQKIKESLITIRHFGCSAP